MAMLTCTYEEEKKNQNMETFWLTNAQTSFEGSVSRPFPVSSLGSEDFDCLFAFATVDRGYDVDRVMRRMK
jgi:hypothetical protein